MNFIDHLTPVLEEFINDYNFTSIQQLSKDITPYASGTHINGIVVPSPALVHGNNDLLEILRGMEMQSPGQFQPDLWIRCALQMDRKTSVSELAQYMAYNGGYPVCLFPHIRFPVQRSNAAKLLWLPFNEYCHVHAVRTVQDFIRAMYVVVALGFPASSIELVEKLACDNSDDFVSHRLFQGKLDPYFSGGLASVSSFLPDTLFADSSSFQTSLDQLLQPSDTPVDEGALEALLLQQAEMMNSNFVLSNDTEIMGGLTKVLEFSVPFTGYVSTPSPSGQIKIGQGPFLQMIQAKPVRSRRRDLVPPTQRSTNVMGPKLIDNVSLERTTIEPFTSDFEQLFYRTKGHEINRRAEANPTKERKPVDYVKGRYSSTRMQQQREVDKYQDLSQESFANDM